MAARSNHQSLLKKLKKQVRALQRKERQTRNKLKTAIKKINKLSRSYKSKLASKMRLVKNKIAEAQTAAYEKVSVEVQKQLLKNIEAKGKSLKSAINKLEKKHISKLAKSIAQKGKKSKKAGKSKPSSVKKAKKATRSGSKRRVRSRK